MISLYTSVRSRRSPDSTYLRTNASSRAKTSGHPEPDARTGSSLFGNWSVGVLADESGNQKEVFSYFLPTWGLHYVLKTNAPETSGDWAMCAGPV